jgi:UDP-N-acetylmuramoyl-tripeptide--D-alanyl-D-alanine ligase
MISMNLAKLVDIVGGQLRRSDQGDRRFAGVCIDSRQILSGQLFIAIRGQKTDGHKFISSALEHGAATALCEAGSTELSGIEPNVPVVVVADTYEAMLRLSAYYRDLVPATRIGITGSNGKTTTKEFTYALLRAAGKRAYRSPGNLNNLFGAPLAIFAMPEDTTHSVLEMGVSVPGEMAKLAQIVRPHLVAITNVGATHLEFLGNIEGVAREKLSLVGASGPDTQIVVNADDYLLLQEAQKLGRKLTTFGVTQQAIVRPSKITHRPDSSTEVEIDDCRFVMNLFGAHQVYNLLAAYAIARSVGVTFDQVDTESIQFSSTSMRGELLSSHGVQFIVDCYNSNPGSVESGLASFVEYKTNGRRIAILGDMLELGEASAQYHRKMGEQAADRRIDIAVFVGPLSAGACAASIAAGRSAKSTFRYPDARSCARETAALFQEGDLVYVKGSRGIGLEVVVEPWRIPEGVS